MNIIRIPVLISINGRGVSNQGSTLDYTSPTQHTNRKVVFSEDNRVPAEEAFATIGSSTPVAAINIPQYNADLLAPLSTFSKCLDDQLVMDPPWRRMPPDLLALMS